MGLGGFDRQISDRQAPRGQKHLRSAFSDYIMDPREGIQLYIGVCPLGVTRRPGGSRESAAAAPAVAGPGRGLGRPVPDLSQHISETGFAVVLAGTVGGGEDIVN